MKLSFVEMSGFRGYRDRIRIDFGTDVTIIDGRNGVGKSTIFDAVEYALTGTIAKYLEAKANRESVADYIWWLGDANGPDERYVSVGFIDRGSETIVTRSSLKPNEADNLDIIVERLFDDDTAPVGAIRQVCASAIIRDELIAALSLDLKDTDRYALLSSAIGATGSEEWIAKAKDIHESAQNEMKAATSRSERVKAEATQAQISLDAQRARSLNDPGPREAIAELAHLMGRRIDPSDTIDVASRDVERLQSMEANYRSALDALRNQTELEQAKTAEKSKAGEIRKRKEELSAILADRNEQLNKFNLTESSNKLASQLSQLASLGEDVGCDDDTCPLCKSIISIEQYENGIQSLRDTSANLNAEIARSTELKNEISDLEMTLETAEHEEQRTLLRIEHHERSLTEIETRLELLLPEQKMSESSILDQLEQIAPRIETLKNLIPRLNVTYLSAPLQRLEMESQAKRSEDQQAERALSLAQKKEADCKKLFDGVRKAANDAFNQRLDRILPLITELYARLRPHPNFQRINYTIRGELRRYLSFTVGDHINPQFVYSSGQRRATGLAFLISVNLSMAWSRWSSLLLDDPVQHIDDFRSVHLAELLGQLVREQRQIVCAVEDPALADLLCRKMPVTGPGSAKRITLGADRDGNVTALRDQDISPMRRDVFQQINPDLAG